MKQPVLSLLLALSLSGLTQAEEREFASKQITFQLPKGDNGSTWRLDSLPFKEWLDAVTFPDCELLYSSETEDFYFAVFRAHDHLIFWAADRKGRNRPSSLWITAEGRSAKSEQEPSKWVILKFLLKFPNGSLGGQNLGTVLKIKDGLHSDVTVHYSVGEDKGTHIVFERAIPWGK
jgi:hypothetical protein